MFLSHSLHLFLLVSSGARTLPSRVKNRPATEVATRVSMEAVKEFVHWSGGHFYWSGGHFLEVGRIKKKQTLLLLLFGKQPELYGPYRCLRAVGDPKLVDDAPYISFDRRQAD